MSYKLISAILLLLISCSYGQEEDKLDELEDTKQVRNAELGVLISSFAVALIFSVVYYLRVGKVEGIIALNSIDLNK